MSVLSHVLARYRRGDRHLPGRAAAGSGRQEAVWDAFDYRHELEVVGQLDGVRRRRRSNGSCLVRNRGAVDVRSTPVHDHRRVRVSRRVERRRPHALRSPARRPVVPAGGGTKSIRTQNGASPLLRRRPGRACCGGRRGSWPTPGSGGRTSTRPAGSACTRRSGRGGRSWSLASRPAVTQAQLAVLADAAGGARPRPSTAATGSPRLPRAVGKGLGHKKLRVCRAAARTSAGLRDGCWLAATNT